ncbi:hypothetical protein [Calothrix rhizosoleniae]|uniref:hypothetical protein n=1 Tax=Calothrix rhizosoleniae TaxID=888997 RepID=UPI000B49B4F7|nr:hypothetical protein [Calothrix rhizosoleniae]
MGYYDIAKNLLEFAQNLLNLGDSIAKKELEKRLRIADYLDKIAKCIDDIVALFERGEKPYGGCGELDEYLRSIFDTLQGVFSEDDIERYERVLTGGALARGALFIVKDAGSKEIAQGTLEDAAGRFRALANRLRI